LSSSSQTYRRQNTQENNKKKNQKKGGSLPFNFRSTFSLLATTFAFSLLHFPFQVFSLGIFFFSNRRKKKHKEKKTIEKKKYAKKGRSLPLSSCSTSSFFAPAFAFSLLHFHFKCFLLTSFFS